jgi:hypothetical protein
MMNDVCCQIVCKNTDVCEILLPDVTQKFNSWKSKPYYFGIAQEVVLYQKIGFAEFRWDYFAYGSQ